MTIERRPFGRTGHMSSAVIFGGAALGEVDQAVADGVLDLLFEFGVNHIDTAASYGDAELRIGPWMAGTAMPSSWRPRPASGILRAPATRSGARSSGCAPTMSTFCNSTP